MATTSTTLASLPPFVADRDSLDFDGGHTIDWAAVPEDYRETAGGTVTVGTGGAAIGATTVPVTALPVALASGTVLWFGTNKFARLSAAAAKGATSITVLALPTALVAGETATAAGTGKKFVPAGTMMAGDPLTNAQLVPTVDGTLATCLLATAAREDSSSDAKSGYGVILGGVIYENLLPQATGSPKRLPTAGRTALQTAGTGTGWSWRQYRDNTA